MFRRSIPAALAAATLVVSATGFAADVENADVIARGRYVAMVGGCNDCHTPGFTINAGQVPDKDWLVGDGLGWSGPWGTTYPPNLRLKINAMDLATFKTYARTLKTRPPMPYWAVNALSDADVEALWAFVHSLGPAGSPAPAALPPGAVASGPVVTFPAPPVAVVAEK